jgi:phosphoserine / homoserine phosphotransferase
MQIICLDLEGVLIPEIWIGFAEKTGIEQLRLTTRDIPDYDVLMNQRLAILREHGLGLHEIQEVIDRLDPLPGARDFLDRLREEFQVILLSDTFYEFAMPLMRKLGWPTLFCHKLSVAHDGSIANYLLRIKDPKRKAVKSLHDLNFKVIASGDSYNDTNMLSEADAGILFCAPENVIREFPQFPVVTTYEDLYAEIRKASSAVALAQR